jgi:hypothetical protein
MNGRAANGTRGALLCGRSTCGNVACGASKDESKGLQFRHRSGWNQNGDTSACGCRLNGLMAQMADGAVIG